MSRRNSIPHYGTFTTKIIINYGLSITHHYTSLSSSSPLFNRLLYYIIMGYNVQQYARANIYCYYIWPMTTITTTCTYLRVCVDIQLLKKSRREFGWQNLCHLECVPKIIEIRLSGSLIVRDHGMRWNTRVWISTSHTRSINYMYVLLL